MKVRLVGNEWINKGGKVVDNEVEYNAVLNECNKNWIE
jgi:hypothetical protein